MRREVGQVEVADSQGMGGDDVPDVDDRGGHDVVEAVALEEPAPAVLAEVGERLAADEVQRGDEVGHPVGAAALAASAETPEQVEIAEDPVEGVGRRDAVLMGLLSAREVRLACAALPEPLPDDAQVGSRLLRADAEVLGQLLGGDSVRVEREVGKELDVVGPSVGGRCRVAQRPDRDRPEQA